MPTRAESLRRKAKAAIDAGDVELAAALKAESEAAKLTAAGSRDSAPKVPPAGAAAPKPTTDYAKALAQMIAQAGGGLQVMGEFGPNPRLSYDGGIIVDNAERLAGALQVVARRNPAFRKLLEQLTSGSAWGEVVSVVLGTVGPILACHGVIPPTTAKYLGAPEPPPPPPTAPGTPGTRARRQQIEKAARRPGGLEGLQPVAGPVPVPGPAPSAPPPTSGVTPYTGPPIRVTAEQPRSWAGPPGQPAVPVPAGAGGLVDMSGALQVPDNAVTS